MAIGTKATVMAAAVGALVLGAAGVAGACQRGGESVQSNSCDTSTGTTLITGGLAPTGPVNIGAECANFDNTHRAHQSNDCDVATGATTYTAGLAPTGALAIGSKCDNIALAD